ncbi:MAG TPA: DUF1697 domain-containing protein [Deinococcales bacterium]|nr:DUF1697 domain-containing protein [Deinococcales bacterium]
MQFVALLRGINVSGQRKMPMAQLRALLERNGHAPVSTYIASGNVVLEAGELDEDTLRERLEDLIEAEFGFSTDVVIRTPAEWRAVIVSNPFPGREEHLHVSFLSAPPPETATRVLDAVTRPPEEWRVVGRDLYLVLASGFAESKLAPVISPQKLKVSATTRNWRTVLAIAKLLRD